MGDNGFMFRAAKVFMEEDWRFMFGVEDGLMFGVEARC